MLAPGSKESKRNGQSWWVAFVALTSSSPSGFAAPPPFLQPFLHRSRASRQAFDAGRVVALDAARRPARTVWSWAGIAQPLSTDLLRALSSSGADVGGAQTSPLAGYRLSFLSLHHYSLKTKQHHTPLNQQHNMGLIGKLEVSRSPSYGGSRGAGARARWASGGVEQARPPLVEAGYPGRP